MTQNAIRAAALAMLMVIFVACGSGAAPSPTALPATFNDYDTAVCGAFTSLIRAYGNPDTNAPSAMRTTLEAAVTAGDAAAAQRAAKAMHDELEAGRRLAATAARWQPGAVDCGQPRSPLAGVRGMDIGRARDRDAVIRGRPGHGIHAGRRCRRLDGDAPGDLDHGGPGRRQPDAV